MMAKVNATSVGDCQGQCTKQREGYDGCTAALEKLCGSVFRTCPGFPCSACQTCTATHKAVLSSAGCAVAEAGCIAPGCTGVLEQFCTKPPTTAGTPPPACTAVTTAARHQTGTKLWPCLFESKCEGVVDPTGKCEAAAGPQCGYRSMAAPPPPPPRADPFARCGYDEGGIEGFGGELNLPFGSATPY